MAKLGLVVNPMSGRDVRRLAARATNMTHEAKRDIVARVAAGADAMGVTDIFITKEPFRIASMALELMELNAAVHVIEHELKNDASDTQRTMEAFVSAGCETFVSLGGDGTNRAIVREFPDITLVPLSTGTNNVFPVLAEPTVAGMVAGLHATRKLEDAEQLGLKKRVKVLHIHTPKGRDVGLIDAVLLRNDNVGNFLPFDPAKISQIVLSRAEPNSIGMSPIGGLIQAVHADDDFGLSLGVDAQSEVEPIQAPISPGLFKPVHVTDLAQIAFEVAIPLRGPGVIALDGDRDIRLQDGEHGTVTLRRDGPWVLDIEATMRWAVAQGMMAPENLKS